MLEACTNGRKPSAIAGTSTRMRASVSSGLATSSGRFVATPASSKFRSCHATASAPAAIDPPETLATRSNLPSKPNSFSRNSAPRWNSIARNSAARQTKADAVLKLLPTKKIGRDRGHRLNAVAADRVEGHDAASSGLISWPRLMLTPLSPAISIRAGQPSIERVEVSQPSWQRSVGLGLVRARRGCECHSPT